MRMALSPTPPSAKHGPERWTREDETVTGLVVSSETLAAGADSTLEAVLHDAAHVLCWVRDVQDTTSRGAYHNSVYRNAAAEVGLVWPDGASRVTGKGYVSPALTDETREWYADEVAELARAIPLVLPHLVVPETARRRTPDRRTLACGCDEPRTFRISPTVADRGPIICGVCEKPFT